MEGRPRQSFTPSEALKLDRAEDLATSLHTQSCLDVAEGVFLGAKGPHFKVTAWLQWFKCPLQSRRGWRVLIWLHCYHRWFLSALQSSSTKSRWWKNSLQGRRDNANGGDIFWRVVRVCPAGTSDPLCVFQALHKTSKRKKKLFQSPHNSNLLSCTARDNVSYE